MGEPMRGVFPVLQTPVRPDGELEPADLEREVAFCLEAGVHGLVFPVLGSEFQFLTDAERHRLVEVVVAATAGRVPVVVGVAGTTAAEAEEHARQAARARADAVIALPPYLASAGREEIVDYYTRVARAARLPVFIQHSQAGMDAGLLTQLLEGIDEVQYVKEEMHPSAHQISALLRQVGPACLGVFGGAHGRWMMSELHRGATGFMPAVEAIDVHVQVWEAYQAGDEAAARRLFNRLLPLLNLVLILGLPLCKAVLVRRGVFSSAAMRTPGSGTLDAEDERELDRILEDLAPLFRAGRR
ncbi:MAG: dihydrodipicolinate synthase family protein [Candidatus Latescibacterota bacterium]|jgi:4-hydroxy-tetrahydrodipicolinate synthase